MNVVENHTPYIKRKT